MMGPFVLEFVADVYGNEGLVGDHHELEKDMAETGWDKEQGKAGKVQQQDEVENEVAFLEAEMQV